MKKESRTEEKKQKPSTVNILKAFFVSAFGTGVSRVLGAARDIVIAHFFGASKATDAFWIAWTIPSVFRRFVADEGLTGALIPAIAQEERKYGLPAARRLTDTIFTILILGLLVFSIFGILTAPYLVRMFAWGFTRDIEMFELTVNLTRWLFPFVAMVSLVSYCEGVLNHRNHFFIPKIAPGLVSAGMIIFVVFLFNNFQPPIYSLAAGVLAGGIFHLVVQLPVLVRLWFLPRLRFLFNIPRVKFFLKEMGKVIVIGIFAQLNVIVLRLLASFLTPGSVTHYWNANRIIDLTHGMIAIGMASALMPALAKSVADEDWQGLRSQLEYSIKVVAFFLFPACGLILFFNKPIVSILFRHGSFTYQDTLVTAATLQLLIPFLLCLAGINIVKKVYFAIDDRNTLLAVGGFGVLLTASIGGFFIGRIGVRGLAVALSISTLIQLLLYYYILKRKLRDVLRLRQLFFSLLRIFVACIPFSGILIFLSELGKWELGPSKVNNLLICLSAFGITVITYLVSAYLLKISELKIILGRFKKRS
jgi:putative peptidoglycan lipid II flippase